MNIQQPLAPAKNNIIPKPFVSANREQSENPTKKRNVAQDNFDERRVDAESFFNIS